MTGKPRRPLGNGTLLGVCALLLLTTGCRRALIDGSRLKPMEGEEARPVPAHTIARDDEPSPAAPPAITPALLARGRERYDIFCSVCHGRTGEGQGMIVQRGFPPPPTFHQPRLREAPAAHYFDVMTNGFGVMYPYRTRVTPADRWAITAYIRALQRSQNAALADAPAPEQKRLEAQPK